MRRPMAKPSTVRFLSQDPAGRIAWRFETSFERRLGSEAPEVYPALLEAWEEALEYHRTIELRPAEVPHAARVRDTVCRLLSLLPDAAQAGRHTARIAAGFFYPASARTTEGRRAFSYLALLCHVAVRDPLRADGRFGEVNPRTHAMERRRGQESITLAELARLVKFLGTLPAHSGAEGERPPSVGRR